jgi:hypothetical protein
MLALKPKFHQNSQSSFGDKMWGQRHKKHANTCLVPSLLVLKPRKTDRMSFPNDAALTGSNLCSLQ